MIRFGRIAFTLVASALALLAWSFAQVRLDIPELAVTELPRASPPEAMSVSALPTGEVGARAAFAYRGGAFDDARAFAQTALLVRHPRGDLLFDTGLGAHAAEHVQQIPWIMQRLSKVRFATPAASRLRAAQYDIGKLAGLVPTHVHWDHISGVPDFPGVPVWLNEVERGFIDSGGRQSALMRSFGRVTEHPYRFASGAYLGYPQSCDVWGDGSIVLVPAAGHTPGSILAFITLPSKKRLLLLGDLVWQTEGITLPAERPWLTRTMVDHNPAAVRDEVAHVAALHKRFPELVLLPAHDERAMASVPVFPAAVQ